MAAWWVSWSTATERKSPNWNSTIGRMLPTAAPTAAPTTATSEQGVSRTRSRPNSAARPVVTPKGGAPAMSSPIWKTVGSRRISSRMASLIAPLTLGQARSSGFTGPPDLNSLRSNPLTVASRPEVLEGLAGLGERALPRELHGGGDLTVDLGLQPSVRLHGEEPFGQEPRAEPLDRALLPGGGDLLAGPIGLWVVGQMAAETDRLRLDERRAPARPRPRDRRSDGGAYREGVVAVHHGAGQAVPGGAVGDRSRLHGGGHGLRDAVAVILAEEDERERPHGREVGTLVHRALIGRAVAEEGEADAIGAPELLRERHPRRHRRLGRDDAAHPDDPTAHVGHVVRLALVVARAPAVELGHDALRVEPAGDLGRLPAMRGEDEIARLERPAGAGRHGLLPGGERRRDAPDLLTGVGVAPRRLQAADEEHRPQQAELHRGIHLSADGAGAPRRARPSNPGRAPPP